MSFKENMAAAFVVGRKKQAENNEAREARERAASDFENQWREIRERTVRPVLREAREFLAQSGIKADVPDPLNGAIELQALHNGLAYAACLKLNPSKGKLEVAVSAWPETPEIPPERVTLDHLDRSWIEEIVTRFVRSVAELEPPRP